MPGWLSSSFARAIRSYKESRARFDHELAVCAIFRDEGRYLAEWLRFHHGVGVEHFFLYDNGSVDDSREILEPWIRAGLVTVVDWPRGNQPRAYAHCIARRQYQCRWIAFIDIDEFLFSPKTTDLRQELREYEDVSSLFVYWILFGSSGHVERPKGDVIDNYTKCLLPGPMEQGAFDHRKDSDPGYVTGWVIDGKSIVNPRSVREYYVHKPRRLWYGEVLDENRRPVRQRDSRAETSCSVFRINHYWSKSQEDLRFKASRPRINVPDKPLTELERWLERESELNRDEDFTIQSIWNQIRAAQEKSPGDAELESTAPAGM